MLTNDAATHGPKTVELQRSKGVKPLGPRPPQGVTLRACATQRDDRFVGNVDWSRPVGLGAWNVPVGRAECAIQQR